jgi:pyridoxamine 5'-phosphate oxidase-like protein
MHGAEVRAFLAQERVMTCATLGPRGWPHLMPLWFVTRPAAAIAEGAGAIGGDDSDGGEGERIWAWTYAASQKVRNLERDPRATLQVETGESYEELRGVMFECEVRLHRETADVAALGREIFMRYASPRGAAPVPELPAEVLAMIDAQAVKRVGLEFVEQRRASWDHRKLGGVY